MSGAAAEQLIYMRVEPAYSPQRRAGFQTVWRSAGLRAEEVAAVEERVQCFQADEPRRRRVQFFTLPSGLAVVARTVTVESDREIVDRDQRPGVFGAHCLALRQAQFAVFENNPFAVLDVAQWLDNPRQMVAAFGQASGEAPRHELSAPPLPTAPAALWHKQDARRLVVLGWSAAALRQDRQAVLVGGDSEEIEGALRLVFSLLPRARRLACSFNTFGERCPAKPGEYWAIGGAQARRLASTVAASPSGRTLEVDARTGTVRDSAGDERTAKSYYLVWLEQSLGEREPAAVMEQSPTVEALSNALAGEGATMPGRWDRQAVRDLFAVCREAILQQLTATARPLLPGSLAKCLAGYLLSRGAELDANLVLHALSPTRDGAAVAFSGLAVAYLSDAGAGSLADADLRHLRQLARAARNWVLLHWASTVGAAQDDEARDQALESMSSEEFKVALNLLRQPIPAADFAGARHFKTLLRHERLESIGGPELVELIEAALRIGEGGTLAPLAGQVARLSAKDMSRLERAVHGKKGAALAPELRRAIDSCATGSRTKAGWLGRLR